MRRHTVSFKHAFDGIVYVFRTQPNFRFHSVAMVIVLLTAALLGVSLVEWVILLFTIMLVLVTEMINTAIEAMTDLLTKKFDAYAKISKDVSAGMVLLSAMGSVVVGLVIFGPKLLSLFNVLS